MKRLDDLHTAQEAKANRLKRVIENPIFKSDAQEQVALQRTRLRQRCTGLFRRKVFPFIKELQSGREDSTYAHHMKDGRFTIPTPGLLAKVVDMVDKIPMEERDVKGDLYEYMLSKIATAGQNGQFRTLRHIIKMMVEMVAPQPSDVICSNFQILT